MARISDPSLLHPAFRRPLLALLTECSTAGIPLHIYETVRSPNRQAELYAYGRGLGSPGRFKTHAHAWDSLHQYAVAADLVFFVNDAWTWEEPRPGMWADYTMRAARFGLRTLSFERPHVELPVSLGDLQNGRFSAGGDGAWRDWIEHEAERWGRGSRVVNDNRQPGAPAALLTAGDRPDLVA